MNMLSREDILKTEFSPEFIKHMQNSMEMGFHIFSTPASESPDLADGISYNELMREMEDLQ